MGNWASFSDLLCYCLIGNCATNEHVSLTMTDLRLVVLGCLMLVAFAQSGSKSGDVLSGCLFTPHCVIDDVRGLARDLRLLASWKTRCDGAIGALIECIDVIAATEKRTPCTGKYCRESTGCYDDVMVKKTGCDVACDVVKKLLPVKK